MESDEVNLKEAGELTPEEEHQAFQTMQADMGGAAYTPEDLESLKRGAAAGDSFALSRLGISYLFGVDGILAPNPDHGLELLYSAGIKGFGSAFTAIGRYWSIEGYDRKAFPWFQKAADMGDQTAHWEIGYRLDYGKGVKRDSVEAIRHYQTAVAAGDPRASHNMAMAYMTGDRVPRDKKKARALLEVAAAGHVGEAHYQLSLLYEAEGRVEDARESLLQAARLDTPVAQFNVAVLYLKKTLEPHNRRVTHEQEACAWFQRAARLDLVEAQLRMGYNCVHGMGTAKDETKATEWFLAAAQQGDKSGRLIAAHRMAQGLGLPGGPNLVAAREIVVDMATAGSLVAGSIKSLDDAVFVERLRTTAEKLMTDIINLTTRKGAPPQKLPPVPKSEGTSEPVPRPSNPAPRISFRRAAKE